MTVREVVEQDRQQILALVEQRDYPDSVFFGPEVIRPEIHRFLDACLQTSREGYRIRLFAAEREDGLIGYLMGFVGERESITGQPQMWVADCWARAQETYHRLLDRAALEASQWGDQFLVAYSYSSSPQASERLADYGFHPELIRVVKRVEPQEEGARHPDYRVRAARPNDKMFVLALISEHSPIYVPAGRNIEPSSMRKNFVGSYVDLSMTDPKRVVLILEQKESRQALGYIILEPNKTYRSLTLYIYDIAVEPGLRGKGLSHFLMGQAETLLGRMGGGVLFGDVSADNQQAVGAQKGLGFQVDSTRWGYCIV